MHTDKTFRQNNIPSILKTFKKRALKTTFKAETFPKTMKIAKIKLMLIKGKRD